MSDVSKNFRKLCLNIFHLNAPKFISAPGLAWQAALKRSGVKLEILTDINLLLIFENGMRGRICNSISRYAKANNKYIKNFDKINNHYILNVGK